MASQSDVLGRATKGDTPESPFYPTGGPQQALSIAELLRGPGMVYLQLNDRLLVRAFNQTAVAQSLLVTARVMRLDGQVMVLPFTMAVPANAVTPATFDLAEGYLLDLVIGANGAGFTRGTVFVQAGLARGNAAAATQGSLLISGYPAGTQVLGWPYSSLQNSTDGQGLTTSTAVGNPLAGNDFTYTVPAGLRQKLRAALGDLTTSAVAGTRSVIIVIDDGAASLYGCGASGTQAAALVFSYAVGAYPFATSSFATNQTCPIPPDVMMLSGWRVRSITQGILAGDQWSNIRLSLESWVDNQ